jgi:hypothetical protein
VIIKLFSARVFTLVFGGGYALSVYENHPLFRYYPLVERWSMHDLKDPTLGPAMSYYGWIAMAAIPAVIAAALVPYRIGERIPAAVYWLLPLVMLLVAFYNERTWFF